MTEKYVVTGFYRELYYVSEYRNYGNYLTATLNLSKSKNLATKMDLSSAADAAKLLKNRGFVEINIKEIK